MSKRRVLLGGSFCNDSSYLRSTVRSGPEPEYRSGYFGFRIVVIRRKP